MIYSAIFILLFVGFAIAVINNIKKGNKPAQEANNDLNSEATSELIDDLFN